MNERNQSPPTWKVYTMREAAREFVRELWQHAAQNDPNLEKWARAYLLELNQAAAISAPRSQDPGSSAPAAVVLPFPAPQPSQLPPAAARRNPGTAAAPRPHEASGGKAAGQ